MNRMATIVIEHLIQAFVSSYSMQHWQIFRKRNERGFEETYEAFKSGWVESDPTWFGKPTESLSLTWM